MKITILFFILVTSFSTFSKPSLARMTNIQVDSTGNLTTPDLYHYMNGLRFYSKGAKKTALTRFKFAAEFGSKKALKYIALMYLDGDGIKQNIIKGTAWLKLSANRGDEESIKLLKELNAESDDNDKESINKEWQVLKESYGRTVVLNNVYKYYRRFRFQTLDKPNKIKFAGKNVSLSEIQIRRLVMQIKSFYNEKSKEIGEVIQQEIIEKENDNNK